MRDCLKKLETADKKQHVSQRKEGSREEQRARRRQLLENALRKEIAKAIEDDGRLKLDEVLYMGAPASPTALVAILMHAMLLSWAHLPCLLCS